MRVICVSGSKIDFDLSLLYHLNPVLKHKYATKTISVSVKVVEKSFLNSMIQKVSENMLY